MRQVQHIEIKTTLAMRIWKYVSKPFQITKVLELLYMLDWIWYAVLSFFPPKYITGAIFQGLATFLSSFQISLLLTIIALSHMLALFRNIVWLRKLNLLFNIGLLLNITAMSLLKGLPIAAGIGYLIILIGISIFVFWRMDELS